MSSLLRGRAQEVIPEVHGRMNTRGWLVTIIVYVVFTVLILSGK